MDTGTQLHLILDTPGYEKFRHLYEYWASRRNRDGRVLRKDIDPLEIGPLLANLFLVDIIGGATTRYRFRLVGTEIVEREGNITGKFLDELVPEGTQPAMHAHYADAAKNRLYIRTTDLGWMRKDFSHYRVLLLPLYRNDAEPAVLLGLVDYI